MVDDTFHAFELEKLKQGFDEVRERQWAPHASQDSHTHPFSVEALVVQGEMWLTVDDHVQHLRPGETFALDAGVLHSERYGAEGARYWAARRNGS